MVQEGLQNANFGREKLEKALTKSQTAAKGLQNAREQPKAVESNQISSKAIEVGHKKLRSRRAGQD